MNDVYLASGRTSEYEDSYEWHVGAFVDYISCSNYVNKLNQLLIDNNLHQSCKIKPTEPSQDFLNKMTRFDPGFTIAFSKRGWEYAEYEYYMNKVPILATIENQEH